MEKTEIESAKKKIVASVKSPARDAHLRVGQGFSLAEIKAAGKTVILLKELNIKIDYFRKTAHEWNIQQLKALKPLKRKKKEKEPYLSKEERIKSRQKVKKRVRPTKEVELVPEIEEELFYEADEVTEIPEKPSVKPKPAPKEKPIPAAKAEPAPAIKTKTPAPEVKTKTPAPAIKTKTPAPVIKAKTPAPPPKTKPAPEVKEEPTGIPLTELSGLGVATAKKFKELGVTYVPDLLEEDADELAMLIGGVSADRIKKWMQEGKELLNK